MENGELFAMGGAEKERSSFYWDIYENKNDKPKRSDVN